MQFFRISVFLLSKIPRLQNFKHSYLGNVAVCGKMDNWGSFPIVQRYLINVAYAWHPLAKLVLVQKGQKTVKNTTYGLGSEMKSEKKIANFFLICCLWQLRGSKNGVRLGFHARLSLIWPCLPFLTAVGCMEQMKWAQKCLNFLMAGCCRLKEC